MTLSRICAFNYVKNAKKKDVEMLLINNFDGRWFETSLGNVYKLFFHLLF